MRNILIGHGDYICGETDVEIVDEISSSGQYASMAKWFLSALTSMVLERQCYLKDERDFSTYISTKAAEKIMCLLMSKNKAAEAFSRNFLKRFLHFFPSDENICNGFKALLSFKNSDDILDKNFYLKQVKEFFLLQEESCRSCRKRCFLFQGVSCGICDHMPLGCVFHLPCEEGVLLLERFFRKKRILPDKRNDFLSRVLGASA